MMTLWMIYFTVVYMLIGVMWSNSYVKWHRTSGSDRNADIFDIIIIVLAWIIIIPVGFISVKWKKK